MTWNWILPVVKKNDLKYCYGIVILFPNKKRLESSAGASARILLRILIKIRDSSMICYRDMTFCPFWVQCTEALKCHRALTKKVAVAATKLGLPIAQFTEKPECFVLTKEI